MPNPGYSGGSSDDNDSDENDTDEGSSGDECPLPDSKISYQKVYERYSNKQTKLEPLHNYKWVNGKKKIF